jgi:hypothetical protein
MHFGTCEVFGYTVTKAAQNEALLWKVAVLGMVKPPVDAGTFVFFSIFFWGFFFVLYSALLHLPPRRFRSADGCWDRTQDRATGALAVRRSNH